IMGLLRTKTTVTALPAFRNDTPAPPTPRVSLAPGWGTRTRRLIRRGLRLIRLLVLFFVISTVAVTLVYRFVPPPVTPLMVLRLWDQYRAGEPLTLKKDWTPLADMSPWMP